jgi:hypothetical protein
MKFKNWVPFTVITALFLAALLYQISGGADYHAPPVFKVSADEPAARSYAKAVTVLTEGRATNLAIALLKHALTQDPNNAEYHAALASAYTTRAAVIYRAFFYYRLVILKRNEDITAQRQSIAASIFGGHGLQAISTVPPYHALRLKDDGSSFRMSNSEAVNAIVLLEDMAADEWNKAHKNAENNAQAADIDYQNACSDRIFYGIEQYTGEISAEDSDHPDLMKPLTGRPFEQEAFNEIHSAALAEPNISMYWVLTADFNYGFPAANSHNTEPPVRPFLLKALAIEPNNNALRMDLCESEGMRSPFEVADLLCAAKHDPRNSVPLLLASMAILHNTHYRQDNATSPISSVKPVTAMEKSLTAKDVADGRQALSLFQQGIRLSNIHMLVYEMPFAPLLIKGQQWSSPYQTYNLVSSEYLFHRGLSDLNRLALSEAIEKHPDEGAKILSDLASLVKPLAETGTFDKSAPPYWQYFWHEIYRYVLDDKSSLLATYGAPDKASKAAAEATTNDMQYKEYMKKYEAWFQKEINEDPNGHMPY